MFYVDLFRELEKFEVRYLLVGGVAVNLHGIGRLTADIDLMLALDAENLSKFVSVGKVLGLKPIVPIALADVADAAKVKSWIEEKGNARVGVASTGQNCANAGYPRQAGRAFRGGV